MLIALVLKPGLLFLLQGLGSGSRRTSRRTSELDSVHVLSIDLPPDAWVILELEELLPSE